MYGLPPLGAGLSIRDLRSALSSRMLHRIVRQKNHRQAQPATNCVCAVAWLSPIKLDASDIDTLQHDLGHHRDVSLRKLDPLLPAKHRQ